MAKLSLPFPIPDGVAPCGAYCAGCREFIKKNCPGCRPENETGICPIFECVRGKGLEYCLQCEAYHLEPCNLFNTNYYDCTIFKKGVTSCEKFWKSFERCETFKKHVPFHPRTRS